MRTNIIMKEKKHMFKRHGGVTRAFTVVSAAALLICGGAVLPQKAFADENSTAETNALEVNISQDTMSIPFKNQGFETGDISSWQKTAGEVAVCEDAYAGEYAAKFTGGEAAAIQYTLSGLTPNTTYTISAWMKMAQKGEGNDISLCVKSYGGGQMGSAVYDDVYTKKSITFTTGANNTKAVIFFWKNGASDAYADSLILTGPAPLPTVVHEHNNDSGSDTPPPIGSGELINTSAVWNSDNNKVIISGKHTGGAGRYVAVRICKSPAEVFYEDDMKVTEADGSFKFEFTMDMNSDVTGTYTVDICGTDAEPKQESFYYEDFDAQKKSGIKYINEMNSSNKDELPERLNVFKEKGFLSYDLSKYNMLDEYELPTVNKYILDKKPFADFKELESAIDYAMDKLNNPTDSNETSGGKGSGSGGGGGSRVVSKVKIAVPADTDNGNNVSPADDMPFDDIAGVEWAREGIISLFKKGIINGTGNRTFEPDRVVKREEFVKMMVNTFNIPKGGANAAFSDVNKDEWYYDFIAAAKAAGIVSGIGDDEFGVGMELTREDMITMLYRAAKTCETALSETRGAPEFRDGEAISDYAKEGIEKLYMAGLVDGTEIGLFAPKDMCTRAMAAKLLYAILQNQ